MNSTKNYSATGRSLALVLGLALAGSAYAGPSRHEWRPPHEEPVVTLTSVYPHTEVVPDMVTTSCLPNERSSRQQIQVGTKRVSYGTTEVKKASLPNGRGPLRRTEITYRYDTRAPYVLAPHS